MAAKLDTPLKDAIRTTPYHLAVLGEKLGLHTVGDLILYFPRRFVGGLPLVRVFAQAALGQRQAFIGRMGKLARMRTRTGKTMTRGVLISETGEEIDVTWWSPSILARVHNGDSVILTGTPQRMGRRASMTGPDFTVLGASAGGSFWADKAMSEAPTAHRDDGSDTPPPPILEPIYSETDRITSGWFREKIWSLRGYIQLLPEILPNDIIARHGLLPRRQAVYAMHFPQSQEELDAARRRLAFEELFVLQLASLRRRLLVRRSAAGASPVIPWGADDIKAYLGGFPFSFTEGQKIALYEVLQDISGGNSGSRLLQGDTGSGKTAVAETAIYAVAKAGYQAALMAPTEILATQHYRTIAPRLLQHGISVGLLVGSMTPKEKKDTWQQLATGRLQVVVGTHALVGDAAQFARLGLAVVDEQHRFGVEQRRRLATHGHPHVLYMSATPIPRTLAMVVYGDHDLSIIRHRPAGRAGVHTAVCHTAVQQRQAWAYIADQAAKGHGSFIICPLVGESEKLDNVMSAEQHVVEVREQHPKLRVELLHGRVSDDEKDAVLGRLARGEADVLVATSVVEVGIDIPTATGIIIHNAERFGLSQLHQLRGRVGRGSLPGHCFLFTSLRSGPGLERLRALEASDDGFVLAEADLQQRGPGEVYGLRQSGMPDLAIADLTDKELLDAARAAAEQLLDDDWTLTLYPQLRALVATKENFAGV